jgi:hypothetical protein
MALQVGKDVFGLAKQSGKGTIAANPYFTFGLAGGGIAAEVKQEPDKLTSAYLSPAGAFRSEIANSAKFDTRAFQKSLGLLLYGALGACSTSGGAPAVAAVLTTALTGVNNDLTFLAKTAGTAGNSITVALVATGNDTPLSVDVASSAITVNLATGSGGAVTSTATEVRNAINVDAEAAALITASLAPGNSGSGVVTALSAANLAGGAAAGGGGAYTHVITLGSSLSYLTAFQEKGDGTLIAVQDCKVDEVELSWEGNKPVKVTAGLVGGLLSFPATMTATVDETAAADYFTPVGGTFKYDVDSSTPAEADVLGGKVTVKRNAEAKYFSGSIDAGDVFEGVCDVEVALTVIPEDMTLWRNVVTGSTSGTAVQSTPLYGSLELNFVRGADSLKIECANVAFIADMPEANPDGGAAEIELAGIAFRVAGTPLTATLVNAQATY